MKILFFDKRGPSSIFDPIDGGTGGRMVLIPPLVSARAWSLTLKFRIMPK